MTLSQPARQRARYWRLGTPRPSARHRFRGVIQIFNSFLTCVLYFEIQTKSSDPPLDGSVEQFQDYLIASGVMGSLTTVLMSIYEMEDKPIDPLEYLKQTHKKIPVCC